MAISRARATQNSDPCGPSLTPLVSARDVIPFFCLCFPRLSVFASSIQEDSSLRLALRMAPQARDGVGHGRALEAPEADTAICGHSLG